VEATNKVQKENQEQILRAFSMSDVHTQVLQRVARDLGKALVSVRKRQVDGDVTLHPSDFADLKLHPEGELHLSAYYEEYQKVGTAAGEKDADVALSLWAQGMEPEVAVDQAREQRELREARKAAGIRSVSDSDEDELYETQHFGGTSGQSHQQQEPQAAQADG
jgi:hypothetical protein